MAVAHLGFFDGDVGGFHKSLLRKIPNCPIVNNSFLHFAQQIISLNAVSKFNLTNDKLINEPFRFVNLINP